MATMAIMKPDQKVSFYLYLNLPVGLKPAADFRVSLMFNILLRSLAEVSYRQPNPGNTRRLRPSSEPVQVQASSFFAALAKKLSRI
jgi:hypothetical protein